MNILQSFLWKRKFILSLVAASTPWGGSVKSILYYLSGDDYNNPAMFDPVSPLRINTDSCNTHDYAIHS